MPRTSYAVAFAVLVLTAASTAAVAAPLDPEGCAKLKASIEEFEKGGVRDNMARGPAWAKANLPAEKLEDIRRLLEADEQHLFRCPGRHLVNLPLEPDPPPPPPSENKADGEPKAAPPPMPKPDVAKAQPPEKKASDKAKSQPPQQKKVLPPPKAPTPAANEGDGQKQPPKAKSAQKPKAKRKDDAYKPPPGDNDTPSGLN